MGLSSKNYKSVKKRRKKKQKNNPDKFWAKTDKKGNPVQTIFDHSLLTGIVAEELIKIHVPDVIKSKLPEGTSTLISTHDIGKLGKGFIIKLCVKENFRKLFAKYYDIDIDNINKDLYETNHAVVSESSVLSYYNKKYPEIIKMAFGYSEAIGKHHGFRFSQPKPDDAEAYGGKFYSEKRHSYIEQLEKKFGNLPTEDIDPCTLDYITGLLSISDFIASQLGTMEPYMDLSTISEKELRKKIRRHIVKIGLKKIKSNIFHKYDFKTIFNFIPNNVQKATIDIYNGRGTYLIESLMGSGKTEAAFMLAYLCLADGNASGIYTALPTRTTSNRLIIRLRNFIKKIINKDKSFAKLIHSTSFLDDTEVPPFSQEGFEFFNSNKKALLYPFGLGTVDQVLLSIVNSKFSDIRFMGLADKVVIIDEIHSYDILTGTLIAEAIKRLEEIGCTIIVLSATLTESIKKELFGVNFKTAKYPSVTYYNSKTDRCKSIHFKSDINKEVKINFINDNKQNREKVVKDIISLAKKGCKVLVVLNTVERIQKMYKMFKEFSSDAGLLHSRFCNERRKIIEDEWVVKFENKEDSKEGSVLFSTQIVEQSLDIDADALYSDLCPIDIFLQRIGRGWRHLKNRLVSEFVCNIFAPDMSSVDLSSVNKSKRHWDSICKKYDWFGCRAVYSSYLLFKTYKTLEGIKEIKLPDDMVRLLNSVYESEPSDALLCEFKKEVEEKKEKLKRNAFNEIDNKFALKHDEDTALTRSIDVPTERVIITKNIQENDNQLKITFMNEDQITINIKENGFPVYNKDNVKKIHQNMVVIPQSSIPKEDREEYKEKYNKFFRRILPGRLFLLKLENNDLYLDSDKKLSNYCYNNEYGFIKKNVLESENDELNK